MSYISVTDAKTYMDISGSSDDTLLGEIISAAQRMIDAYCGRAFEASADTVKYLSLEPTFAANASDLRRTLFIPYDLCQITTLKNGDGSIISASDYLTTPRNAAPYYEIILRRNSGLAWVYEDDPEDAVELTGRWAYSVQAPEDIVHACKRLAQYLYKQRDNAEELERPIASGDGLVLLPGRMPKDVKDILSPYRKRVP